MGAEKFAQTTDVWGFCVVFVGSSSKINCSELVLESTNTAPFNLKYYISMKGIAFTYHLSCITDH